MELEDVPVHSLVPEPLQSVQSVSEFMSELPKYDGDMANTLEEAEAAQECLRFVGALANRDVSTDTFYFAKCITTASRI